MLVVVIILIVLYYGEKIFIAITDRVVSAESRRNISTAQAI
jgi:hypothetical protein